MATCKIVSVADADVFNRFLQITGSQEEATKKYLDYQIQKDSGSKSDLLFPGTKGSTEYTGLSKKEMDWFKANVSLNEVSLSFLPLIQNEQAFGKWLSNGEIILDPLAIEGTLYHEAFHSVSDMHLAKMGPIYYNKIRAREGEVNGVAGVKDGTSYSQLTDNQAEEVLAEEFKQYMLEGILPEETELSTFFEKLLAFLRSMIGLSEDGSIKALFEDISSGQFNYVSAPESRRVRNKPMYSTFDTATDINSQIVFDAFNELSLIAGNYMFNQGTVQELLVKNTVSIETLRAMPIMNKMANRFKERNEFLGIPEDWDDIAFENVARQQALLHQYGTVENMPDINGIPGSVYFANYQNNALFKVNEDLSVEINQPWYDALLEEVEGLSPQDAENQLSNIVLGSEMLANWKTKTAAYFRRTIGNYSLKLNIIDEDGFSVDIDDAFFKEENDYGKNSSDWNEAMETNNKEKIKPALKALLAFTPEMKENGDPELTPTGYLKPKKYSDLYKELKEISSAENPQDMYDMMGKMSKEISSIIIPRLKGRLVNVLSMNTGERQRTDMEFKQDTALMETAFIEHFVGKQDRKFFYQIGSVGDAGLHMPNDLSEKMYNTWRTHFYHTDGAALVKKAYAIKGEKAYEIFLSSFMDEAEVAQTMEDNYEDVKYMFARAKKTKRTNIFALRPVKNKLYKIAREMFPELGTQESFSDFDGKRKYSIFLKHSMAVIADKMNRIIQKYSGEERVMKLREAFPHLFDEDINHFVRNSKILKAIKEGKNVTISVDIMTGVQNNQVSVGNRRSNEVDYLDQMLTAAENGYFAFPQMGNRPVKYMFKVEGVPGMTGNSRKQFVDTMLEHLADDVRQATQWEASVYEGMNDGNYRFFDFLNLTKREKQSLKKAAYVDKQGVKFVEFIPDTLRNKVEKQIGEFFDDAIANFKAYAEEIGYAEGRGEKKLTVPKITDMMLHNMESFKLFFGDPKNFKSADSLFKRLSGFSSTRRIMRNDPEWLATMDELWPRKDGKPRKSTLSYVAFKDQKATKERVKESVAFLEEIFKAAGLKGKKLQQRLKPYKDMNVDDAFTEVDFDTYRDIKLSTAEWSAGEQALFDLLQQSFDNGRDPSMEEYVEFTEKHGNLGFHSLKTIFLGPEASNGKQTYIKHSAFPMLPMYSWIYDADGNLTKYGEKFMFMKNNQVNMLVSGGALKSAKPGEGVIMDYKDIKADAVPKLIESIDKQYGGIQTDMYPKMKSIATVGSQIRTLIEVDIWQPNDTTELKAKNFKPDENATEEEWLEEAERIQNTPTLGVAGEYLTESAKFYDELQSELYRRAIQGLLYDLGVTEDGQPTGKTTAKLKEMVLRNAQQMKLPEGIQRQIAAWDKVELLPRNVESIILAMFRNRVNRETRSGSYMAQVAPTYLPDVDLKFYRKGKNGEILPAQTMIGLPLQMAKKLDRAGVTLDQFNDWIRLAITSQERDLATSEVEKLKDVRKVGMSPESLLDWITIFGYRIPTQALGNADTLQVAKFLPPWFQGIVTYPEIVAKAGSDYDIDKLTIYIKQLLDKKGDMNVDYREEMSLYEFYQEHETALETKEIRKTINAVYEEIRKLKKAKVLSAANFDGQLKKLIEDKTSLTIEGYEEAYDERIKLETLIADANKDLIEFERRMDEPGRVETLGDGVAKAHILQNLRELEKELSTVKQILGAIDDETADQIKSIKKRKKQKRNEWQAEIELWNIKREEMLSDALRNSSEVNQLFEEYKQKGNFGAVPGKVVQNHIIKVMSNMLLAPGREADFLSPIDASMISDVADNIREQRGDDSKMRGIPFSKVIDPTVNLSKFTTFRAGDGGIGAAANHLIHRVKAQKNGWDYSAIENNAGESITEFGQAYTSSMIDIENDPYAIILNFSPKSTDAVMTAARSGEYGFEEMIYMFAQPGVHDLVREMNKGNTAYHPYPMSHAKAVENVLRKYGVSRKEAVKKSSAIVKAAKNTKEVREVLPLKKTKPELKAYDGEYLGVKDRNQADSDIQEQAMIFFLSWYFKGQSIVKPSIRQTTYDTKGPPKTMSAYRQVMDEGRWVTGFLGVVREGMDVYKNVLEPYFLFSEEAENSLMGVMNEFLRGSEYKGIDALGKAKQKIKQGFLNYLAQEVLVAASEGAFRNVWNDLVNGDLNKELSDIQSSTSHPLRNNFAINSLVLKTSEIASGFSVKQGMSSEEKDLFTYDFERIKALDSKLAKRLVTAIILQAGFDAGSYQYALDLIPIEMKLVMHENIKNNFDAYLEDVKSGALWFPEGFVRTNPGMSVRLKKKTNNNNLLKDNSAELLGQSREEAVPDLKLYIGNRSTPNFATWWPRGRNSNDPDFRDVHIYKENKPTLGKNHLYKPHGATVLNYDNPIQQYYFTLSPEEGNSENSDLGTDEFIEESELAKTVLTIGKMTPTRDGYEVTLLKDKGGKVRAAFYVAGQEVEPSRKERARIIRENNLSLENCK